MKPDMPDRRSLDGGAAGLCPFRRYKTLSGFRGMKKGGQQRRAVYGIVPRSGKAHTLRMPLDTENGKGGMGDGLHHMIRCTLYHAQLFAGQADALMVGAVDNKIRPVESIQKTARGGVDPVGLILPVILMIPGSGKILNDCAAEENIDDLHSLTDAQNRFPGTDEEGEDRKLLPVQNAVNIPAALIGFSEKRRIDVAASGKQERVTAGGLFGVQTDQRIRAQLYQRVQIVAALPYVTRNQNFSHGKSLFKIERALLTEYARSRKGFRPATCRLPPPAGQGSGWRRGCPEPAGGKIDFRGFRRCGVFKAGRMCYNGNSSDGAVNGICGP